jgi:hypothetical protein
MARSTSGYDMFNLRDKDECASCGDTENAKILCNLKH